MTGRPLLQLALDAPEHLALLPSVRDQFDLIEVGTPLLKRFGTSAITTALELGGGRPVLADTKTADGAELEARLVLTAGASYLTVLAHASRATRLRALEVADGFGAVVVLDTILDGLIEPTGLAGERDPSRTWIALHAASDARAAGDTSDQHVRLVAARRAQGYRTSVAGGIGRHNLAEVLAAGPDVVVVGSGVTAAARPEEEAEWLRSTIDAA